MKKFARILGSIVLILLVGMMLSSCAEKVTVPDVANVTLEDAKTALSDIGLISTVEYAYSDDYEEGLVMKTEPQIGEQVESQAKITLTVSKGPEYVDAKNASVEWFVSGAGEDEWNLYSLYIHDDVLYIQCKPRFASAMRWKGDETGFGAASIGEAFTESIPLTVEYEKQKNAANTEQNVWLIIPLEGLGDKRPSNVYTKLYVIINGVEKDIRVNFTIAW